VTIKLGIAGASGRMGRMLLEAIAASEYNVELSAAILRPDSALCGVDTGTLLGGTPSGVLFTEDIKAAVTAVDVLVDFTPPAAAVLNAQYCAAMGTPLVSGTTGFSATQDQQFHEATRAIALCQASNFSTGVNLAYRLLAQAAAILGSEADIEISEAHHRHKVDAPSGTAIAMGEVVAAATGRNLVVRATPGSESGKPLVFQQYAREILWATTRSPLRLKVNASKLHTRPALEWLLPGARFALRSG
jgi:4-hydroxy-tetrahydrodipicolinate reductase